MADYQHWHLRKDKDGIIWLALNQADRSMNTLASDVLQELDKILTCLLEVATERSQGLVIYSTKASGFIAGADIQEFTRCTDKGLAKYKINQAHQIFAKITQLPYPSLAMINGICLGGGLELALACHYRLASDKPSVQLGFPEVRLGIFPGYGGSVRSVQKLGVLTAMNMMLTGRNLNARQAKKIGLIDQIAPERQLEAMARYMVLQQATPQSAPYWQQLLNFPLLRPATASLLTKQVKQKAHPAHYPAPYALIKHWQKNWGKKAFASEADAVAELMTRSCSKNLIRVFFLQEQMKALGKKSPFKAKRVHVIGAGIMGGDIAIWCALQGLKVSVQDRDAKALVPMMQRAYQLFQKKLRQARAIQQAMDCLVPDIQGQGLAHADVVIEAIFENKQAKQQLYQNIEPQLADHAILATNTSSIPLEALTDVLQRPERFIGLHFFNPVEKMSLVEVVYTASTSPDIIKSSCGFTHQIRRLPLPVKSNPGFLVNRVLMPYMMEAFLLESEGVSPRLIDKAALEFGMPMGPIELADLVGLDICYSVATILSEYQSFKVPERLAKMVEMGHLGKKTGRGFYHYKKGKLIAPAHKNQKMPVDLCGRLVLTLLNEAMACLDEKIVESADLLDAGIIFGTGFAPFRGGPLHHIQSKGYDKLYQQLQTLEQRHGKRFVPHPSWLNYVNSA